MIRGRVPLADPVPRRLPNVNLLPRVSEEHEELRQRSPHANQPPLLLRHGPHPRRPQYRLEMNAICNKLSHFQFDLRNIEHEKSCGGAKAANERRCSRGQAAHRRSARPSAAPRRPPAPTQSRAQTSRAQTESAETSHAPIGRAQTSRTQTAQPNRTQPPRVQTGPPSGAAPAGRSPLGPTGRGPFLGRGCRGRSPRR